MDNIIITSFILSILSIISNLILHVKLKHCHFMCVDSECMRTPHNTPTTSKSVINLDYIETIETIETIDNIDNIDNIIK